METPKVGARVAAVSRGVVIGVGRIQDKKFFAAGDEISLEACDVIIQDEVDGRIFDANIEEEVIEEDLWAASPHSEVIQKYLRGIPTEEDIKQAEGLLRLFDKSRNHTLSQEEYESLELYKMGEPISPAAFIEANKRRNAFLAKEPL